MTTYDLTTGTVDKNYQTHQLDYQVLSRLLDFSVFASSGTSGTAADISKIITIPAGFVVEECIWRTIANTTPTTALFAIGDSSSGTFYFTSASSSAATVGMPFKTTAVAGGFKDVTSTTTIGTSLNKLYTAADYISVTQLTTAATTGQIQVIVRGCQLY